jgi:S1-C subfamily serine protease
MKNAKRLVSIIALLAAVSLTGCAGTSRPTAAKAAVATVTPKSLAEQVRPSLVVVRYTYDSEMGRRELEGAGIVLDESGLIGFTSAIVPSAIPDAQMINFKIVLPPGIEGDDEVELDATFLGRDDRSDIAFVKPKEAGRTWKPLKPEVKPIEVGDTIYSIGMLPKGSGYALYSRSATVSAKLRGPVKLILTSGNLPAIGSAVFDSSGTFVGIVPEQEGQTPVLNPDENEMATLMNPPVFVISVSEIMPSIQDPPTAPNSRKTPWMGVVQMTGLKKEVADFYGLKGKPGIQIGDVIPGAAAEKAGLKGGEIITAVNGAPLERGDTPEELPMILGRQVSRMNVGDPLTLTVIAKRGEAPKDVTLNLIERPAPASTANRFYAEDLGFTVRDMVFQDRYARRLEDNVGGVVVTFVKPQGNAQAGGLARNDVITKINQTDVTTIDPFKEVYATFRKESAKESVVLEVLRGTDTQIVRIQPPQ